MVLSGISYLVLHQVLLVSFFGGNSTCKIIFWMVLDLLFYIIAPFVVLGMAIANQRSGAYSPALCAFVFSMSCSWLFTAFTLNYFSYGTIFYLLSLARSKGGSIPKHDYSKEKTPLIEGMTDIPLREEIYSLAMMCTLHDKELEKYYEEAEIPTFKMPSDE